MTKIKQKVVGVIPARHNAKRLPGKPLKDIEGLPMVVHVLKRAQMATMLDEVIVATDDERIAKVVKDHSGKVMITSSLHDNATERMNEVSYKVKGDIFVLINGDEALVKPEHIDAGVKGLISSNLPVSMLFNRFDKRNSLADFKVVLNKFKEIMYISRNDIPSETRTKVPFMYKGYGIISYTKEFLRTYVTLDQTPLDRYEMHELVRILENGYKIQGVEVESSAISADTAEDLKYIREVMKDDIVFKKYKT